MAKKKSSGPTSAQSKAAAKKKAKSKARGKRAWKALGSGSALVAGLAMTKALDATWQTATGRKPPTKPENPEITGREALLWAALSGMAIGVAKTYATRRAAQYWVRSTGELPPGMKDRATKADAKRMKKQAAASS
jgi:hypothetical protein